MLPTKDNIIDAIRDSKNIKIQELNGFKFILSRFGDPLYFPGGFGMVFKLESQGDIKALKVWYVNIDNIKDRLRKVSAYLAGLNLPYFVSYNFYEGSLVVPASIISDENDSSDQILDALIMDWADGYLLKDYFRHVIEDESEVEAKNKLTILANQFKNCFKDLHQNHISHGDIQHGNIIIKEDSNGIPQIKLIDYDSLFVPSLSGCEQTTSGIGGFQHPKRIAGNVIISSEKDDYFSEKVLYLTALILAAKPSLWGDPYLNVDKNDYGILFTGENFADFKNCYLYQYLKNNSNIFGPEVLSLLYDISCDLDKDPEEIIALSGTVKSVYFKEDDKPKQIVKLDPGLLGLLEGESPRPPVSHSEIQLENIDRDIYRKKTS